MSITFHCPSCNAKMSVPDQTAGKRGKCSKCKSAIQVPGPPVAATAAPKAAAEKRVEAPPPPEPVAPPPSDEDVEAAALAALADEPKQVEEGPTDRITFECPQCNESVTLAVDLAGKKHPCPSCRRIVAVPRPAKKDPATWRDTGPNLPSGAKRDVGPIPDDVQGGKAAVVSEDALRAAGAIQDKRKPATLLQRSLPFLLLGTPVVLLLVGGVWLYLRLTRLSEQGAYQQAIKAADTPKAAGEWLGDDGRAALHAFAGVYQTNAGNPKLARDELDKALALSKADDRLERDAFLLDLLRMQTALTDLPAETEKDKKDRAADVQKRLAKTLLAFGSHEARLEGLRRTVALLAERKELPRVLPLARLVYGGQDADQAEAFAVVALELARHGATEPAAEAADVALRPYRPDAKAKEKPRTPELRPAAVALAVSLGQKLPPPGNSTAEKENDAVGQAAGLAYRKQPEDARKAISGDVDVQARAAVEVAAATGEAADVAAAVEAMGRVRDRTKIAWHALRLVELARRTKDAGRVTAAAALVQGALAGWGRLIELRAKLESSHSVEEAGALDALGERTLAGKVGRLELTRHNVRHSGGWGKKAQAWEEGPRSLGNMGVALGLQGR